MLRGRVRWSSMLLSCVLVSACAGSVWRPQPETNAQGSRWLGGKRSFAMRSAPQIITLRLIDDVEGEGEAHLYTLDDRGISELWSPRSFPINTGERLSVLAGVRLPTRYAVVQVNGPTARLSTVVDLQHAPPATVPAPLVTWESTLETELLMRALERQLWKPTHTLARLRSIVTPELADAVLVSLDFDASTDLLLHAALAGMDAWHDTAKRASGASEEMLRALYGTLARRQAALDLELLDATFETDVAASTQRFAQAEAELYAQSGLSPVDLAEAASATARVLESTLPDPPSPMRAALRSAAAQVREAARPHQALLP